MPTPLPYTPATSPDTPLPRLFRTLSRLSLPLTCIARITFALGRLRIRLLDLSRFDATDIPGALARDACISAHLRPFLLTAIAIAFLALLCAFCVTSVRRALLTIPLAGLTFLFLSLAGIATILLL